MLWLPTAQSRGTSEDAGGISTEGEPALHASPGGASHRCPVRPVSTFLGMWCVAVEMTLAIHIYNDLKQFTSQLKQDLSCDNPEETVTY